jgi:hypothetical protein
MQAEVHQKLRAYWRGEPNGKHGLWAVCPICREQPATLGVGTWGDPNSLRITCWAENCEAGEMEVLAALGVQPEPWSREGMLQRVERAILRLEWSLRDILEPPDIPVPGEQERRWAA